MSKSSKHQANQKVMIHPQEMVMSCTLCTDTSEMNTKVKAKRLITSPSIHHAVKSSTRTCNAPRTYSVESILKKSCKKSSNAEQSMPVYLVFLQVAKIKLQFALIQGSGGTASVGVQGQSPWQELGVEPPECRDLARSPWKIFEK